MVPQKQTSSGLRSTDNKTQTKQKISTPLIVLGYVYGLQILFCISLVLFKCHCFTTVLWSCPTLLLCAITAERSEHFVCCFRKQPSPPFTPPPHPPCCTKNTLNSLKFNLTPSCNQIQLIFFHISKEWRGLIFLFSFR